jgi:hypothetical protein
MKALIVSAVLLTAASTGFAQTGPRVYGGVELGAARLDNQTGDLARVFVTELGGSAIATQDANIGVGRLFLGYRFDSKFAVEGGYFSTNEANYSVSGVTGGSAAYTATAKVDYQGFDVSALWFPMAQKFDESGFFLKAGLHHSETNASVTIIGAGGSASVRLDDSGTGTLFGAGYDWSFSKDAFLRAGVTRYLKVGGESENNGTVYSLSVGTHF